MRKAASFRRSMTPRFVGIALALAVLAWASTPRLADAGIIIEASTNGGATWTPLAFNATSSATITATDVPLGNS
jgi:hypothetical protein